MEVLIIGNSRYSQGGYADLPGVKGDLQLWAEVLDANRVSVAQDLPLSEIRDLDFGEFDLVIYSGHGVQMRRDGHLYEGLAFMTGRKLDVLWDTEVSQLRNFDRPLWYMDCCHSGGLMDARVSPKHSVTRAGAHVTGVRTIGAIAPGESISAPSVTRALAPVPYRVVTTARKHELALEVSIGDTAYGLGTYALHNLLRQKDQTITDESLMELMLGFGGRRASQPVGNAWDEFDELLRRGIR